MEIGEEELNKSVWIEEVQNVTVQGGLRFIERVFY